MNDTQRQNILRQLDVLLERASEGDFDILDDARSAIKRWDLQGDTPYWAELAEWGVKLDLETAPTVVPVLSEADAVHILQKIQRCIAARPDGPEADAQRVARRARQEWRATGRVDPLPHPEELAAWNIWPPTTEPAEDLISPPPPEPSSAESGASESPSSLPESTEVPDPDDALVPEYETARSLMDSQPYQAKQRLSTLQSRAQGRLVERIAADLTEVAVTLQQRTEALLIAARLVVQQQPRNLAAQAEAWRAVTAINPASLESQEALQRLQQRVRQAIEDEMDEIGHAAESAAKREHLPDLNAARGRAEALRARDDLPGDLEQSTAELRNIVLGLLEETRDRLGVASTKKAEGELRESYKLARKSLDGGIPVLIDTAGILGPAQAEVSTLEFFRVVSGDFLTATRQNVEARLSSARAIARSAPEEALARLNEARGWLTDDVWTPDHRQDLRSQLDEVQGEIEEIGRLLQRFEEARQKIVASRAPGVAARTRLELLNQAQLLYPDYPHIDAYLEEARDNLSGELAGEVEAQIVVAQRLTLQEQFDAALGILSRTREAALRSVPNPKPDSRLTQALARVVEEEKNVGIAEQALRDLQSLLAQVEQKLTAYDEDKNLLTLDEARALLEQVPDTQLQHPTVVDARGRLAARQGDAENYAAGRRAYDRRDWPGARDYFDKVGMAFSRKSEADTLSRRAQAAIEADAAFSAEAEARWPEALKHYTRAVYLFGEAGDDALMGNTPTRCREAKQSIEENDRKFRAPLEEAQTRLARARSSVPAPTAPLPDRLDAIAEFPAIMESLVPLASVPSALSEDIKTTVRQTRQAWREAYLPALREAAARDDLGEALVQSAFARAGELKEKGLFYEAAEERLYYALNAQQLDQAYEQHLQASPRDWAAIERNRRQRLDLPLVQRPQACEHQWMEAQRERIEGEIRTAREQGAAQRFLEEQLHAGRLPAEPHWLQRWLELCWEAGDWAAADRAVDRMAGTVADPHGRKTRVTLWSGLTRAARAYAEDDIEGARSYVDAVRDAISDDVIDSEEEKLERQTLLRLLDVAERERRKLEAAPDTARPEHYFTVARAYGLALTLSPNHPVAKQGLQAMSGRIAPVLTQRCEEARTLHIFRGDLKAACAAAARVLGDLKALEAIAESLTLTAAAKADLTEALEIQEGKKDRWYRALAQLELFEKAVADCLASPETPYPGDPQSGGWDFAEVRGQLTSLRVSAIRERDRELQELVDGEIRRLDGYEDTGHQVMEKVHALLKAIDEEQFEVVIAEAQQLEALWRRVTVSGSAWDGLADVIRYMYRYPVLQEVRSLREHRERAIKQRDNVTAWQTYEKEITRLYNDLSASERELLDDELDLLKQTLSLDDIQVKCATYEKQCAEFLHKLDQNEPEDPPMSFLAERARAAAAYDGRQAYLSSDGGTRARVAALKAAAGQMEADLRPFLDRLRNFYNALPDRIKNGRRQPTPNQIELCRKVYQECRRRDPLNNEALRLRGQLEKFGFTF